MSISSIYIHYFTAQTKSAPWCPRSSTTARCSRRSPRDFIHLDLLFPTLLPILLRVHRRCSMPSSAVGSVGNDKGAVYCFLFIPPSVVWAAGLSRWGYPPLNPGRPPERARESTRTPLISPEKLALLRPARGAPLASSLAGFFRETGGQWGPHPRTSPCAPVWPTASAYGFFASEKSKP